jgi:hypothetical protein
MLPMVLLLTILVSGFLAEGARLGILRAECVLLGSLLRKTDAVQKLFAPGFAEVVEKLLLAFVVSRNGHALDAETPAIWIVQFFADRHLDKLCRAVRLASSLLFAAFLDAERRIASPAYPCANRFQWLLLESDHVNGKTAIRFQEGQMLL